MKCKSCNDYIFLEGKYEYGCDTCGATYDTRNEEWTNPVFVFDKFKIRTIDNDTHLYWSNQIGWTDFDSATIFKKLELYDINMPIDMDAICWLSDKGIHNADGLAIAFSR